MLSAFAAGDVAEVPPSARIASALLHTTHRAGIANFGLAGNRPPWTWTGAREPGKATGPKLWLARNGLWISLFSAKQRRGLRVDTTEAWPGEVQRADRAPDAPEKIMRKPARAITADEYIRRIDRALITTSIVIVVLAMGLFAQMV
jgi:hypothetical protein